MLVTCYYDIYNNLENFTTYMQYFSDLGNSGIPVILFTDPSLASRFNFPYVTVISVPLETFELYSIGMKYNGELPSNRNLIKDIKEYLSLMNTKIEFVKKAAELVEVDTFIWVDFAIFKLIKNKDDFIKKIKLTNEKKYTNMAIPGCWNFGTPFSYDSVNWRFCGTLFIIPRHHIDTFYNHSKKVVIDFCTQYKLTWEVNIWNIIEYYAAKDIIDWYFADHNDSLLNL